ncbi:MAG: 2Fe-2S iron-sulfur cluster-binding protein [Pseudomonadota bacterium]
MSAENKPTTLQVRVWRGTAAGGDYQSYQVPVQSNQTVLDVVTWIQQKIDNTLSYRFACRVGMCGSCAMTVNGEPRWTCRTHVNRVARDSSLEISPLRNLPVIKDLTTDMDAFFDKWVQAGGVHEASRLRTDDMPPVNPDSKSRRIASEGIECINCAVCYSACDTVAANPEYLGPAALQRAWTLVNDEKHNDKTGVLSAVSDTGGCHNCHSHGSCTRYCPVELNPMKAVAGLKRATVARLWRS